MIRRLAVGCLAVALVSGCADRRIVITSDPPGASVVLNDQEVGRTPLEARFTYFGEYDVRLSKDGYEPLWTSRLAVAPWYEYPPFDLAAEASPVPVRTVVRWHFVLSPVQSGRSEEDLMERARELRARTDEGFGSGGSR